MSVNWTILNFPSSLNLRTGSCADKDNAEIKRDANKAIDLMFTWLSVFEINFLFGNEIEAVDIICNSLVGSDDLYCLLEGSSETMMMVVPLEPVVTMIPVCQVTQVTDFHYSFPFFIAVFLHPAVGFIQIYFLNTLSST